MADNQTRVVYKAIADFSALSRAARKAKKDLADLKKEEAALNASSVAGSAAATVAAGKTKKGREALVKQFEAEAGASQKATASVLKNAAATREAAKAAKEETIAVNAMTGEILDAADASDSLTAANKRAAQEFRNSKQAAKELGNQVNVTSQYFRKINGEWVEVTKNGKRIQQELNGTQRAMRNVMSGATNLNRALDKLGNWRPRLIPPFIALIPIIGGVLALINPLIAGLGGVSTAALGFASSLGRVAAGAIGAIPALTTLMSVIAALKLSFGGIGNAFKAFGQMKQAASGGGGGSSAQAAELSRTEELARAQERYARSIQDVAWAQEDLDEARKDYIKRVIELQKAVDRAAMSEARAAANSQLARENYANVLADPGSTKGQKMDAKVGVDEAVQEQKDVIAENKQNAADLAQMKRDGMKGDREVIRAQRALTDAIWAQRDAQLALQNTQSGANEATTAAATAANLYEDALAKLSPSARKFVENLVSMNGAWTALKRNVQEQFFKNVADDVLLLRNIFPSLEYMLGRTADALGRLTSNFIKLVTSPEWQKDLMIIGDQNVPIIDNIGAALLSWVQAFKDLSIAAGPFLIALTDGMKEGAANFSDIVADARADGSLAAYLEEVRVAMSKWWRIVKNIGKTLFNYSAAAGEFGEWLTDGFVKMTEAWVASSEAARQEGSPFQQYLEDIKPLLTETKGLFGDFFGWLSDTMMDPENIRIWTEMVQILRERLGPALGEILDVLTKSEIGEGLLESVSSILEFIVTFLKNGGADGFKAFYDAVTLLFDILNQVAALVPAPVLTLLATTFGTLAALRFFHITKLLGLLLSLVTGGKISKLSGLFSKLGGPGAAAAGAAATTAAGTVAGAGGTRKERRKAAGRGGGRGGLAALGAGLLGGGLDLLFGGLGGKKGGAAAAPKGGKGFDLFGSAAKGAGKGVGIAAIASIAATIVGDLISSGAAEGGAGGGQRVGGNVLGAAGAGAGIGALLGSIVPGLGTGIGAAAGGVIGAGVGLATSSPEDLEAMVQEWGNFFSDMGGWIEGVWTDFMNWLTVDMPGWLQGVWDGFMNWLTVDLPAWLASIGEGFYNWLTVDLPFALGFAAGQFWKWLTIDMPAWLLTVWNGFLKWLTVDMPRWLLTVWNGFMRWLTVDMPRWLASVWNGFLKWLTVDLPRWIGQAATNFWNFLTIDLPRWIGQAATKFWNWLTVELPKAVVDAGKAIGDGFLNFFKDFFSNTGSFFESIGKAWNDFWGGIFGNFGAGFGLGFDGGKSDPGDVPPGNGMRAGPTVRKVASLMGGTGLRVTNTFRTPEQNRASGGSSRSLHMDAQNPAMDIAGPVPAMNKFARLLGMIGGWRQLYYNNINAPGVGHWPGHEDHIHVANTGGKVPGRGNGDTVPSMLTPGEFVIRKSIVSRIGADNMARLNAGVLSYAELLQAANAQKGKTKQQGGGLGGEMSFFNGGGLVPDFGGFGGGSLPPGPGGFGDVPGNGGGMSFGDIHVHNPLPEPASDSLPRTIRKLSYLGGK